MKKNELLRSVAVSVGTTLIIILSISLVVIGNRQKIGAYLLGNNSQLVHSSVEQGGVVDAVKKANPAVVSIIITKNEPVMEQYYRKIPFFGDFFSVPDYRQKGTQEQEIGGGSGFLVSSDGLIVTNKHVVSDDQAQYTVYTNDGKKHSANIIARDPSQDVAIIKISGTGYPTLSFDDSSKLELGQSVIAIGNALGEFRNTVSVGVVSGLSRSVTAGGFGEEAEQLDEVIQTDAAINPGNSGGPLLDMQGNVIGVNVAVAEGSQNIGFALPGNLVKSAVDSVEKNGKISRPFLGVRYVEINDALKQKNKLSVDYGVLVARGQDQTEPAVIPGSPADKAGIVENDIILEIDGTKITEDTSLGSVIRDKKVGDTVMLTILHQGIQKKVQVKLEEYNL